MELLEEMDVFHSKQTDAAAAEKWKDIIVLHPGSGNVSAFMSG